MNRFDEMEETHKAYAPLYREAVIEVAVTQPKPVRTVLEDFVINRIGAKKGVRPYLLRKMYEIGIGKDWHAALPVIAGVELLLGSMYCFNVAADQKAGYTTPEKKRAALGAHALTYLAANKLFDNIDRSSALRIIFDRICTTFYEGQTLDFLLRKDGSLRKTFDDSLITQVIPFSIREGVAAEAATMNLETRLTTKTRKINAAMFASLADIIGVLGATPETAARLHRYGDNYGMALQIINDIQDYSLDLIDSGTREKDATDVFKDIKEGRFGWPCYTALEAGIPLPEMRDSDTLDAFRERLCTENIMGRVALEAGAYALLAIDSLRTLPKTESRTQLMDAAYSMGFLSKYVCSLENRYGIRIRPVKQEARLRADELRIEALTAQPAPLQYQ